MAMTRKDKTHIFLGTGGRGDKVGWYIYVRDRDLGRGFCWSVSSNIRMHAHTSRSRLGWDGMGTLGRLLGSGADTEEGVISEVGGV